MNKYSKVLVIILTLCLAFQAAAIKKVNAQESEKNIIILMDNSGSMRKTDPFRLSIAAASMLIDTVDDNTNLNIIAFGDKTDYAQKLLDKPSKESLKTKLSGLMFDNNRTDLKEGIKEALSQMESVQGEKTIIVLSDGKEDPPGGATEQHMNELYSLGDKAHEMRIKLHCIGLSQYADEDTLSKISSKTGGDYFYSENASELFSVFNKILGSLNGFYTIEQFTTNSDTDREIKLSSYIEEVTIKIASCDNTVPLVDVALEEGTTPEYKAGDKYKIYKLKNNKNSTIRITSKNKESNLVIVQVKSKVQLNINSSSDNLSIPLKVPMDISVKVQADQEIKGLHMDKLEGGIRERIDSLNSEFKFNFKKEVPGKYPVFITAYDGEGNIIAVRDMNIAIKDYPAFFYTQPLPTSIITENSFKVELKQQDSSKIENPSGEIYIEYGDKYEKIPLKFEDGLLAAAVTLNRAGDIRISTRIDVIRDNKNYSYYLPYFNSKVIEKPIVELQAQNYDKPFKQEELIKLKLAINKNTVLDEEKFFILNSSKEKIGEFELTKNSRGNIEVPLKSLGKGENFEFYINADNPKNVKVTDMVSTNIKVISNGSYFINQHKIALILSLIVILFIAIIAALGFVGYKLLVESYKTSRAINFSVTPNGTTETQGVYLDRENQEVYLNLVNNKIYIDYDERNAIGSFVLKMSEGPQIVQGLRAFFTKFVARKSEIFEVWYRPIINHFNMDSDQISDILYCEGERLRAKVNQKEIKINFL